MMRERAEAVIDGVRIMRHGLGVDKALIAIEENKPEAFSALRRAIWAHAFTDVEIVRVPTRYPMGSEKHLVQALTGKETPARALTADIGIVVHNVATAYAIHEAVRAGKPLISRIVTVSGGAVKRTGNFEVPIGTPISHVLDHCGGLLGEPARLLLGGPMMGQPVASTRAAIVKGSNGILALSEAETPRPEAGPCIRCTSCVTACPCGLTPFDMAARIRKEELESAVKIGLLDCIACGSCAWVCPSSIPLVQYFNYAKGKLTALQRTKHKQEETKRLARFRTERMERVQKAKEEAMARMKAERAAKAAAKAAAEAKAEGSAQQAEEAEA
jgi:electron transport complex protein RnfC